MTVGSPPFFHKYRMTIITSPGAPDANAYAGVAEASAFYAARGEVEWSEYTIQQCEAALIKATDYIDAHYTFKSVRETDQQALEAPRYGDAGIISPTLKKATILLALHMLTEAYNAKPERLIASEEKTLDGVGSTSTTYADTTPSDPFPLVTATLSRIANRSSGGVGVIRMINP